MLVDWIRCYPLCLSPAPVVAGTWYGDKSQVTLVILMGHASPHPRFPPPQAVPGPGHLARSLKVFTAIYGKAGSRGLAHCPPSMATGKERWKPSSLVWSVAVAERQRGRCHPTGWGVPGLHHLLGAGFPGWVLSPSLLQHPARLQPHGLSPEPEQEAVRTEAEKWRAKLKPVGKRKKH